jgi:hypothetical protein
VKANAAKTLVAESKSGGTQAIETKIADGKLTDTKTAEPKITEPESLPPPPPKGRNFRRGSTPDNVPRN